MAHSCPECGVLCYCGGDIDDLCFDDSDEQMCCTHYRNRECDGYEFDDDYWREVYEDEREMDQEP